MKGKAEEREKELQRLYGEWQDEIQWKRFSIISALFPDSIFVIDRETAWTYRQVRNFAEHISAGLEKCGIQPGDMAAVSMSNRIEFIIAVLAFSRLGAASVLINSRIRGEESRYILDKTQASWCVSEDRPGGSVVLRHIGSDTVIAWEDLYEKDASRLHMYEETNRQVINDPGRIATVIFTSGSTSRPKGVILTDRMLLRSAFATVNTRHMEIGRRIYVPIPLCHAMGYVEAFLSAMTCAGSIVITSERSSAQEQFERMRRWHVNDVVCISSIMIRWMSEEHPEQEFPDLHAAYWAGFCPEWVWPKASAFFGIRDLGNGYGLTECGSTSHLIGPDDPEERQPYYCGRLKNAGIAAEHNGHLLECRIVHEDGSGECGPEETGEILLKGISVTPGYINDPEATAKRIDEDGWFHTGDLGSVDGHGYLKFLGRIDDMYKVNGENVSPGFVESVIEKYPGIVHAEVVGLPHERCGQAGAVFIEFSEECDRSGLDAWLKEKLAVFQRPAWIYSVTGEEWPRTVTGKISKQELKKIAAERRQGE